MTLFRSNPQLRTALCSVIKGVERIKQSFIGIGCNNRSASADHSSLESETQVMSPSRK
jgi:hypothetical protein